MMFRSRVTLVHHTAGSPDQITTAETQHLCHSESCSDQASDGEPLIELTSGFFDLLPPSTDHNVSFIHTLTLNTRAHTHTHQHSSDSKSSGEGEVGSATDTKKPRPTNRY